MSTTVSAKRELLESSIVSPNRVWHPSAPEKMLQAFRAGREVDGWSAWARHLARRRRPAPLGRVFPGGRPLEWAMPHEAAHRGTAGLLRHVGRLPSSKPPAGREAEHLLLEWLGDTAGAELDACSALEALSWCHALPSLVALLDPEVWWPLVDHLLETVSEAAQIQADENPLVHQLLAGELALTAAYLFPEIRACRKLAPAARKALSAGLVDLTDGEGLLHGKHLSLLRGLMACWTRCGMLGTRLSKGCWSRAARVQYEWLVRQALRLARHDGSHVFSRGPGGAWSRELFDAALELGADEADRALAELNLPGRRRPRAAEKAKRWLPEAACHSEWAALSVLRTGWGREDPRLVAVYHDEMVRLELECRSQVLWSGIWELEVRRNGRRMEPTSPWEEVCWVSDNDVDYLELEIQLDGVLRVQRHVLLARDDRFLFLADAILGDQPAELDYRGRLPLGRGITLKPAEETREGYLWGRRRAALVLPLALPEWRDDPQVGTLTQSERGLELRQSERGSSTFAPLFVDLKPRRMTCPLTWRRLTVAENREILPSDVAVGYRVMVGRQQWLIYRSLAEPGNRTVLGHNLCTGMLVARFGRDGEVEPLIEIEDA